jgi:hypothetical protein
MKITVYCIGKSYRFHLVHIYTSSKCWNVRLISQYCVKLSFSPKQNRKYVKLNNNYVIDFFYFSLFTFLLFKIDKTWPNVIPLTLLYPMHRNYNLLDGHMLILLLDNDYIHTHTRTHTHTQIQFTTCWRIHRLLDICCICAHTLKIWFALLLRSNTPEDNIISSSFYHILCLLK